MYSAKSAYNGLFMGSISFGHFTRVWKTWALPKCRFFIWLAAHNRCWTTDRLAKKGLNDHEKCLLCDQAEETLDHLLVACSFSRVFWYQLFWKFGLHSLAPQPAVTSFMNWWEEVSEVVSGVTRKGLNSLIILGAWTIWIHRNKCVSMDCLLASPISLLGQTRREVVGRQLGRRAYVLWLLLQLLSRVVCCLFLSHDEFFFVCYFLAPVRRPAVVWSILDLFPIFLIYKGAALLRVFEKKRIKKENPFLLLSCGQGPWRGTLCSPNPSHRHNNLILEMSGFDTIITIDVNISSLSAQRVMSLAPQEVPPSTLDAMTKSLSEVIQ
jgi:hypothetical protein